MKSKEQTLSDNRIWYFDLLRIIATFAVIVLHVSAYKWSVTEVKSYNWQAFNFFNSVVRWGVPIFVMISGALFLNHNVNVKKLYKKNILRIVTAFVFWSVLYVTVQLIQNGKNNNTLVELFGGHYHMWFLFMIVGLYMITPFVKKIVETQSLMKYFLILAFVFTLVIPQTIQIAKLFSVTVGNNISVITEKMTMRFPVGFVVYYVLGYYLSKTELSEKTKKTIYKLSIAGFVITLVGTIIASVITDKSQKLFLANFTVNVMLEALGVFVFFKSIFASYKPSQKAKKLISTLSQCSFGMYLVHALIIEQLDKIFGLNTLTLTPVFSTVLIIAIVSCVSFAISWLLNRIPLVNKYIV